MIWFHNPLFEYKYEHNPFGWRGRLGGRRFWQYAVPDILRRSFSLRISFGLPGVYFDGYWSSRG